MKTVGHELVSCAGSSGVMGYWLSAAHGVVLACERVAAGVVRGVGGQVFVGSGQEKARRVAG